MVLESRITLYFTLLLLERESDVADAAFLRRRVRPLSERSECDNAPPHLGMSLPPLVWTSQPATRVEVRGAL